MDQRRSLMVHAAAAGKFMLACASAEANGVSTGSGKSKASRKRCSAV